MKVSFTSCLSALVTGKAQECLTSFEKLSCPDWFVILRSLVSCHDSCQSFIRVTHLWQNIWTNPFKLYWLWRVDIHTSVIFIICDALGNMKLGLSQWMKLIRAKFLNPRNKFEFHIFSFGFFSAFGKEKINRIVYC